MGNILVINTTAQETRVALVENGTISEFYVERKRERGIVGNVYKGRVLRVLPGMQASFVDIGQDKAAFLYVADVYNQHEAYQSEARVEEPAATDAGNAGNDDATIPQSRGRTRPTGPIEERLREGQEILIQVAKEAIGTKGARVTSHITLPGRFLVHMPTFDHIGVSRRIEDPAERERLRLIVEQHRAGGTGFIVRTASEGVPEEQIVRDLRYLSDLWRDILRGFEQQRAPALLYEDLDLATRAARDLFGEDIDELIVDDPEEHAGIVRFVERFMPSRLDAVTRYELAEPLFDAYGIEIEVTRALARKVWLKSGGYLVIDTTEALTAIDINTGKFVGSSSLEETIVQINLEAVWEIVYQLRLRNIGGLIIIDFIDMDEADNRKAVFEELERALAADKAKTNVLAISEFGLVEMTRKRVRESLLQTLCEPCFYCEGRGYIKTRESVAFEILREIRREAPAIAQPGVEVRAHPDVAHLLYEAEQASVQALEQRYEKPIVIRGVPTFHIEQFEVCGHDRAKPAGA